MATMASGTPRPPRFLRRYLSTLASCHDRDSVAECLVGTVAEMWPVEWAVVALHDFGGWPIYCVRGPCPMNRRALLTLQPGPADCTGGEGPTRSSLRSRTIS